MMKAFPGTPTFDQDANKTVWQEGMDLRDYFAASALQGMLAYSGVNIDTYRFETYANASYKIADKMMEARNGNQ